MSDAGRYSLVAWPPTELDQWIREWQDQLGVRAFGLPHLNLRAPFETDLSTPELIERLRLLLRQVDSFEMQFIGMRRYDYVFFLEFELSSELKQLHFGLLEALHPSPLSLYDGEAYRPHLTLALCVLPYAADALWAQVKDLTPPVTRFAVNALSLTLEVRGEVQEIHTFPLDGPYRRDCPTKDLRWRENE